MSEINYPNEVGMSLEDWNALSPLDKARIVSQVNKRYGIIAKSPIDKFVEDPRIGRAVNMFCYECSGFTRPEVRKCECKNCALWLFRTGNSSVKNKEELLTWQNHYGDWIRKNTEGEEDTE